MLGGHGARREGAGHAGNSRAAPGSALALGAGHGPCSSACARFRPRRCQIALVVSVSGLFLQHKTARGLLTTRIFLQRRVPLAGFPRTSAGCRWPEGDSPAASRVPPARDPHLPHPS